MRDPVAKQRLPDRTEICLARAGVTRGHGAHRCGHFQLNFSYSIPLRSATCGTPTGGDLARKTTWLMPRIPEEEPQA